MQYHCTDCSYSGTTSGRSGECPACGSRALARRRRTQSDDTSPANWRLVLLAALWCALIVLIIRNLNN